MTLNSRRSMDCHWCCDRVRVHVNDSFVHSGGKCPNFLQEQGTIPEVPAADSYLNDAYLQMISSDPDLRFFANAGYGATAMEFEERK